MMLAVLLLHLFIGITAAHERRKSGNSGDDGSATSVTKPATAVDYPRLPSRNEFEVRRFDKNLFVAVQYLPRLWRSRSGLARLDVCLDVENGAMPNGFCPRNAVESPIAFLSSAMSYAADRLASRTRVGLSLAYSF